MKLLRRRDLIDMPWKNGGGTTREIATGQIGDRSVWRISRADVDKDGDFSDFEGLIRILTVVSGGGMALEHARGTMDADIWEPVVFDGGLKVASALKDGPLTDLNLMFDPLHCTGEAVTHRGPSILAIAPPEAGIVAFHVLAGKPRIGNINLEVADTAFVTCAEVGIDLSTGDAVLEIRLGYLSQSSAITLCIAAR